MAFDKAVVPGFLFRSIIIGPIFILDYRAPFYDYFFLLKAGRIGLFMEA